MKVIIAGPRDLVLLEEQVEKAIAASGFEVTQIVEGGATGVDSSAAWYAEQSGIPYKSFPADWTRHGKAAGPIRNREMADYADALLVIKREGEETSGTASMIREAKKRGLPVHVEEAEGLPLPGGRG
ncbi:DUF2493 domain-containing protein [Rubrobacter marinus]|uniref:DUF2493 domain-containing protein n=1 Tax=Rubrobacter marinus TaxID=2653852 RepID=A0A6G8PZI2_9ACTN|nr:SLOG family protein [Rubrobacter marinus]QIN79644.1 DUF2493 domain-containing protein [Rubrobacter marinus]